MENIYHPKKLTAELQAAGLPVAGVSSTGRVDYQRDLTKEESLAAKQIIESHDPSPTDQEIERQLFADAGISMQDMLMALWEQAAHGDSSAMSALLEKMDMAPGGM